MRCLGSNVDPDYAKFLPPRIAEGIEKAASNLAPARIGWAVVQDREHTHNRRWIFRPDKVGADPFGQRTVRANMHPGYQNPDAIGPSGPVDPDLSVISVQSPNGRPIALLANYSMHYFGSPILSADYYGRFVAGIAKSIRADANAPAFVGIMSQGTSGDLMWMDYGKPRRDITLDDYSDGVVQYAYEAHKRIDHRDWAPLVMRESRLTLGFRVPNEETLAWARKIMASLNGRLPQSQAEIYAREQIYLHERPIAELKLQALRIGELGIAAIPNEVFAITGLKIKAQSPLRTTFNIELANGAEGYIPPPEQHKLGGYTTWPARTAGLEPQAEPRIVETILKLLEEVAGQPRRKVTETLNAYAKTVLASKPVAYWRFGEFSGPTALDSSGNNNHGRYEDGVAFYVEGLREGSTTINRCAHFAGGRMVASVKNLGPAYSVEMWFWNGLPSDVRPVTGVLFSRGTDGPKSGASERLGIGGPSEWGRLTFTSDRELSRTMVIGRTNEIPFKAWNHVVFVRDGNAIRVHLNGTGAPEVSTTSELPFHMNADTVVIGGPGQNVNTFEGKIDEVAIYDRALSLEEIESHFRASPLPPN